MAVLAIVRRLVGENKELREDKHKSLDLSNKGLGPTEGIVLAELLKFTTFRAGDELISQGIVGRHLYIVLEGSVSICVGETQVATKRVGPILGERSMIFKSLTTATCRAKGRVRCAFLTRTVFLDNCSPALIKMLEHRCRMQDGLLRRRVLLWLV